MSDGIEIELPDFDELFLRIKKASPLARVVLDGEDMTGRRGLDSIDYNEANNELLWKQVESNKRRPLHMIEKIDNFQGLPAPLLRFRAHMEGPCLGQVFSNFLTTTEYRAKWDASIAKVYCKYPVDDLDAVNIAMGFGKYGDCSEFGVGYCQTKPSFGVDSREQLTLCGIQDFPDGSCLIWGTEMEDSHNFLFPEGKRYTRARSHLFSTILVPTGENSFDVEYVLQLEIGGNLPQWITTPVVIDNVKNMFKVVSKYFGEGESGALSQYLKENSASDTLKSRASLLMTP